MVSMALIMAHGHTEAKTAASKHTSMHASRRAQRHSQEPGEIVMCVHMATSDMIHISSNMH